MTDAIKPFRVGANCHPRGSRRASDWYPERLYKEKIVPPALSPKDVENMQARMPE